MQLVEPTLDIDFAAYAINNAGKILGILMHIAAEASTAAPVSA